MLDPHKWEWLDSVVSLVMGVVTGISTVLGWFRRRFTKIDERLDAISAITADHRRDIIMLQAQDTINEARHNDNLERLERIDAKQDAQMELLNDIQARCGPHSH